MNKNRLKQTLVAASLLNSSVALAAEPQFVTTVKPIFTTQLKESHGGYNQTLSKLQVSFAKFNEGLRNSNISFEALMVYPQEISRLSDDPRNEGTKIKNDLRFNNVQGLTDIWEDQGADLIAYFDSIHAGGWSPVGPHQGVSYNGIGGDNVFRHEMGHAHGCNHADGARTSVGNTIMNGNGLPYFSSPNIVYQGVALGDATHNSTALINSQRANSAQQAELNPRAIFGSEWSIVAKHSGMAINVPGNSSAEGVGITQSPVNFSRAQAWGFYGIYDNSSTVQRFYTGGTAKYLAFTNKNNRQQAKQLNWAGTQKFFFITEQSDGYLRIQRRDADLSLDVFGIAQHAGAKIVQWPSNNGSNQRWKFVQNF